jgi:protein-S-isoprenylcysteine O-methyltransferase Ste14
MPAPYIVTLGLWLAWWVSWMVAARWKAESKAQISARDEMRHRVFTIAGVVLLFFPLNGIGGGVQFYLPTASAAWALTALVPVGFAFAWWARVVLGRYWSANVARKDDHRIIEAGPYALVRHPIYTGIILSGFATAFERGTALALAGAALLAVSFFIKARMEEGFLRNELGPAAYDAYRARVPMLVPFWPVRTPD